MKEIFYQSSLPRAGSTLLQNILGQNPDFYVTPTSGVIELVFNARNIFNNATEFKAQDTTDMENGFRGFCAEGVKGFFNAITDKPYVVDKSRGWGAYYDLLSFYQDNPKVICMVRDLRGVYGDMEKQFRKHQHLMDDMTEPLNLVGTTTEKRVDMWSKQTLVGLALDRLKQILLEKKDKHILFVKFEDLIDNPDKEMARIYKYLGVDGYQHDFNNIKQVTFEDDSANGAFGDHTIIGKISKRVEDYNEVLGKETSKSIKKAYPWFYEYFGYK